eukprot:759452-Hanusia_phi.AAC.4
MCHLISSLPLPHLPRMRLQTLPPFPFAAPHPNLGKHHEQGIDSNLTVFAPVHSVLFAVAIIAFTCIATTTRHTRSCETPVNSNVSSPPRCCARSSCMGPDETITLASPPHGSVSSLFLLLPSPLSRFSSLQPRYIGHCRTVGSFKHLELSLAPSRYARCPHCTIVCKFGITTEVPRQQRPTVFH